MTMETDELPANYINVAIDDFIETSTARIAAIIAVGEAREIKTEVDLLEKLLKIAKGLIEEPLPPKPTP
ncbi:MAG: hypothetical protein FD163_445 [Hyphomonadaceae bacterium]|nr:MAG: hypothetical protein FD128_434 [Hyphomonadaceae bacterium]KAF0187170.1 MAG: hypothetical protein FD163_445 [Hyphomonadaceae bacterium]